MERPTHRPWVEHLPPAECWRLLYLADVGRIGVLVDSAPEIYPVNFAADRHTIVFRTDPGNKLRGLGRSPAICFEVDGIDVDHHTGWSILVKGRAEELTEPGDLRDAEKLPLELWEMGAKSHWVRITPTEVTGRRIHRS